MIILWEFPCLMEHGLLQYEWNKQFESLNPTDSSKGTNVTGNKVETDYDPD